MADGALSYRFVVLRDRSNSGVHIRRKLTVALVVTTLLVLFFHLAGDYCRSGFPPITLHGVAVSIFVAAVPLRLVGWLPAIGGAILVILGCRSV